MSSPVYTELYASTAAPIPSANASPPTRPMYRLDPAVGRASRVMADPPMSPPCERGAVKLASTLAHW